MFRQRKQVLVVDYNRFKDKKIITGIAVIAVLLLGFFIYRSLQFRVTNTNPSLGSVTYITPFLKVSFSKELDTKDLSVSGTDNVVKSYEVTGKTITIRLQNMQKDKNYTVNLYSVTAKDGRVIPVKTFTFKAIDLKGKLPKDQEQYGVQKQGEEGPSTIVDPILTHLPYSTLNFRLTALVDSEKVTLQANLKPSKADLLPDKTAVNPAVIEAYKKEVVTYIQSLSIDPAKYTIEYTVTTPSAY